MDFPTILVILTFVTGAIWAADSFYLARRRMARASALGDGGEAGEKALEQARRQPLLVEYSRSFFPVILAVLLIRSFIVEPFRIPSGSMMPTLLIGDFILVNKFDYGLRLPVLDTKVFANGEPQRGDVVVFRYPENPSIDFIKRVIGLPGDHIAYIDKVLFINGKRVMQTPDGRYIGLGSGASMTGAAIRHEDLTGVKHDILIMDDRFSQDISFTVPQGQYFVMGDNRDNSRDSRYWGTMPEKNLIGKAFLIWWNIDCGSRGVFSCLAHLPSTVSWGRIGTLIK